MASIFFKIVTDEIPGQPNPGFTKQREDRTSPYFAQNPIVKLDDTFYDDPSKRQEKSLKYSELNIQPSFRYLIDLMHRAGSWILRILIVKGTFGDKFRVFISSVISFTCKVLIANSNSFVKG